MTNATSHGTIEVDATGRVEVAPDEAIVRLTVATDAKTAAEASSRNATIAKAVLDAVSSQPNHGVTTGGLGLHPITRYDQETRTTTIEGYRATNRVTVKTKVGYAAQVFDAGVAAGANESSGIEFNVQDPAPHRDQALTRAVDRAGTEAKVVATAAGLTIVGVESIDIDPEGGPPVLRSAALRAEAATPVNPDDLSISASVRIKYRTQPGS